MEGICCIVCKNFLSVTPIQIDENGNNICGRCENSNGNKYLVRNTAYEQLAHNFIFPCKFTSEGCRTKINFGKVQEHEEKCPLQIIKCVSKNCLWHGTLIEFVIHNKTCHPKLIKENNSVQYISEDCGCFVLAANIFYLLVQWKRHKAKLDLEIRKLDMLILDDDISLTFHLQTENSEKLVEVRSLTRLSKILTVAVDIFLEKDLTISPVSLILNAIVPESLVSKRMEDLQKIICPKCSKHMVPPILKCLSNHISCVDCTGYDFNFCLQCQESETDFRNVEELDYIAINSQYTCKWVGCSAICGARSIEEHQNNCEKRIYKCLHCPDWDGLLNDLISHDAACEGRGSDNCFIKDIKITFAGTEVDNAEQSLLAHNECFWIVVGPNNSGVIVTVTNYGYRSLYGWYRYEVDLQHATDLNFWFSRTYAIKSRNDCQYSVIVPFVDINKFGGPSLFKITIRIILLKGSARNKSMSMYFRQFKSAST